MKNLVLHPSSTAQWQALIQEANQTLLARTPLNEELECYLVFLLMRFIDFQNFSKIPLGLELLNSMNLSGQLQLTTLQRIGDQCLLHAGFFPQLAESKSLPVSYYVKIGKAAYHHLAASSQNQHSNLYNNLNKCFIKLTEILHTIRELDCNYPKLDPMMSESMWRETGSIKAFNQLIAFTESSPLINLSSQNINFKTKH